MEEKKKKTPVGLIIGIVVGGIVLFIVALILLLVFVFKSGTSVFHGTWECNNNATVTIDSKNFNMYGNSSTYVYSTYKAKEIKIDNQYSKMLINATATKRVLNNKEYADPYTTQYQLVIDNTNKNEMAMINSVTYTIYKCKRK